MPLGPRPFVLGVEYEDRDLIFEDADPVGKPLVSRTLYLPKHHIRNDDTTISGAAPSEKSCAFAATFPFMNRIYCVEMQVIMSGQKKRTIERIVHANYTKIFSYCLSILMNREMAEDACHDVFLKLQKNIDCIDESRNSTPWLLRVARNHCYDICRREKHSFPSDSLEHHLREKSKGPAERLLEKERVSVIVAVMKDLKPAYREVLVLRDIEGFSYREIAVHLDVETKKVKWMLFKARRQIKLKMRDWDEEN